MATGLAKMAKAVWEWGTDVPGSVLCQQESEMAIGGAGWIQREVDGERVVSHPT